VGGWRCGFANQKRKGARSQRANDAGAARSIAQTVPRCGLFHGAGDGGAKLLPREEVLVQRGARVKKGDLLRNGKCGPGSDGRVQPRRLQDSESNTDDVGSGLLTDQSGIGRAVRKGRFRSATRIYESRKVLRNRERFRGDLETAEVALAQARSQTSRRKTACRLQRLGKEQQLNRHKGRKNRRREYRSARRN